VKPETARLVLLGTSGGGTLAWLLALWGYSRLRAIAAGESEESDPSGQLRLVAQRSKLLGGEPGDTAEGLARVLSAAGRADGAPPLVVRREGPEAVSVAAAAPPGLTAVPAFSRCRMECRALGAAGCEVVFRADYTEVRRRALRLAAILLAVGLAALLGLSLLLGLAVLPLPKSAAKVQLVQCVLFLALLAPWPAYAFYRRARRATDIFLDAAAANASVLAEAFAAGRRKAAGQ